MPEPLLLPSPPRRMCAMGQGRPRSVLWLLVLRIGGLSRFKRFLKVDACDLHQQHADMSPTTYKHFCTENMSFHNRSENSRRT